MREAVLVIGAFVLVVGAFLIGRGVGRSEFVDDCVKPVMVQTVDCPELQR